MTWSDANNVVFKEGSACANHSSPECFTCFKRIEEKVGGDKFKSELFLHQTTIYRLIKDLVLPGVSDCSFHFQR